MKTNGVGESVHKNVSSFLSDKPMWAFWIFYSGLCGIMFGAFYAAMYFMVLRWWIPVILIIVIGIIWGSFAYTRNSREIEEDKVQKQ